MTQWLKQSTAATIKFGPFVDDTDGKTAETGLTIQKADVRLSKNGGNMAAANADQGVADAGAPHDEIGYYDVSVDTTDTGTLGLLKVMVHETGALPVWQDFMVVPASTFGLVDGTSTIADSYSADGAQPTLAQAILEIRQFLFERAVSGTTVTVKKPNGSSSAMTFTLDNSDSPTSITRAS